MIRKRVAASLFLLSSGQILADECITNVGATDQMTFTTKALEIDKSCKTYTVNLKHSGSLPKTVMGHNLVVSKEADMQAIATDGLGAGIDMDYLKANDTRVVASTKILGAGETGTLTIDVSKLDPTDKYGFFCSFPGHISMMKGTLILK